MIFDDDEAPPVRPLREVLRQQARLDLRAELSEDDPSQRAQRERQEWEESRERQLDPWSGARHVVTPSGSRLWMTHGQMRRIADSLAGRPPGQKLSLYIG